MSTPIDLSQFRDIFIEESIENLDVMESGLLSMDAGSPDSEVINNVFRAAHSIKGGAGTFGFTEIADFTHILESLLDQVRSGERDVSQHLIDILLESVDCVRYILDCNRNDAALDQDRIKDLSARLTAGREQDGQDESVSTDSTDGLVSGLTDSPETDIKGSGWIIEFTPFEHMMETGNDPYRLIRELADLGEMQVSPSVDRLPDFADLDPEKMFLKWQIKLESDCPESSIREIFDWVEGDCELSISRKDEADGLTADEQAPMRTSDIEQSDQKLSASKAQDDRQGESSSESVAEKVIVNETEGQALAKQGKNIEDISVSQLEASSIRVNIDKVDQMINLVGELVITQSALIQYSNELSNGEKIKTTITQLSNNIQELQDQSMRIRMLPIDFVFQRLPRLIRDLSRTLDKQVTYHISGSQTEVDKTVLEKISDPLVHLIRNALDHGIEPAKERLAAGKPEEATIFIAAEHQSGNVVISISDDGGGMDLDKIGSIARKKGLLREDEVPSDSDLQNLIFMPGFSTADNVSDVSGRGVGLDVVKQNINSLGGDVTVTSTPGEGSEFTITLPLTMSILDGQLVQVCDDTFIIPMINIEKSEQIERENYNLLPGNREVYRFEGEYIPILRLSELYGYESNPMELEEGILVVVNTGKRAAIYVNQVVGQQQVVIRSLETNFRRVQTLAGATILGDGTVALIVDAGELIRTAYARGERIVPIPTSPDAAMRELH